LYADENSAFSALQHPNGIFILPNPFLYAEMGKIPETLHFLSKMLLLFEILGLVQSRFPPLPLLAGALSQLVDLALQGLDQLARSPRLLLRREQTRSQLRDFPLQDRDPVLCIACCIVMHAAGRRAQLES
jgi:hypothetical protein